MVLYPVIRKLLDKRVVLASASPRRQEILGNAGFRFEVVPSKFRETLRKASFPTAHAYAVETAKQKALEVAHRMFQKDLRAPDIVIGADTIVVVGGLILEKPVDKQDAYNMLSRLNGKEHSVFTGVAIVHCCGQEGQLDTDVAEFYVETRVQFSRLSEDLLWEYIHTGEPLDKAGGYGIQGVGGMLVESIQGDFLNVMGFPLNRFCKKLTELYFPPRPEDLQRVKHDSIPAVDTFEILSEGELEGRGSVAGVLADRAQAPCRKDAQGAECKPTVETLPPNALLELKDGFKASKALFTACRLKVFDMLRGEAPLTATEIARRADASEGACGRLLDTCVALGLLDRTERGYSNTDMASLYLVSDSEYSLHNFIVFDDRITWSLFSYLECAVREGTNQHHRLLGAPVQDLFQDSYYRNRDEKLQFMKSMHSLMKVVAHQVVSALDLSRFTSACDLGGCTGALARELARQYPGLKVTVFDHPEVIEDAKHFQLEAAGTEQVSFVPGDFFRDALPEADLYVLCRVLHDWSEDKVHQLLTRISGSCKPGGGLLVIETLLDEEDPRALPGRLMSLNMLVQTQGRARSLGEYRGLLQAHGFGGFQAVRTGSVLDTMLATKA